MLYEYYYISYIVGNEVVLNETVMEDATEEHAVMNAEDVIVVVLTEEELVDHHSTEKDSVQLDPQVDMAHLVEKES